MPPSSTVSHAVLLVVCDQCDCEQLGHWSSTTSGTQIWTLNREKNISKPRTREDWRAWLALAWAIWFGAQYVEMVAASRAIKAIAIIKTLVATVR